MNLSDRLYYLYTKRWVQHASFWFVFFLLMATRFSNIEVERYSVEILVEALQFCLIIPLTYFNLRVLIPRLWNNGSYLQYIIAILSSEAIIIIGLALMFYYIPNHELKTKIADSHLKVFFMMFFKTNVFVASTSLFHFVKEWIKLKDENLKFTEKAQEHLEAELSLLKGQVNPHFLFNTLNNLYSMSLHDSKKTPDMILKLSQLLSYMLYECKDETVCLEQEINFIKNYIELEAIRVEDIAEVHFEVKGNNPGYKIPPLLFIPLVENAFKHGISSEKEYSDIYIQIHIDENEIELKTKNPLEKNKLSENTIHNGLGLENVRKRLELLYPNKHHFEIEKSDTDYKAQLVLKMN